MNSRVVLFLSFLLVGSLALSPSGFFKFVAEKEGHRLSRNVSDYVQKEFWFDGQLIDHFNPEDTRTYKQRYFTIDTFWDPKDGPVILYICGEYECPGIPSNRLYPLVLAQKYKARVLALEHRFYGASQPFGDLSTEHLRYLTTDQALNDLAYFINWAQNDPVLNIGTERPWITYGGSYPGALSAWFRYKFPHLTAGAVASSAVINAIEDYTEYDHQLYLSALKSGKWCAERIQEINAYVEDQLYGSGANATAFKKGYGADSLSNVEFLNYFADSLAEPIQYGNRTGLCQLVASDKFEERYQAMKNFVMTTNDPSGYMVSTFKNDSYYPGRDAGRQWTWQVCSELGWFQNAYKNPKEAFRSQRLTNEVSLDFCKKIFGDDVHPHTNIANLKRGGLKLDVSNLIMVNGDEDPWKWASRLVDYGQVVSYVADCDNCAHCVELYTPTDHDAKSLWWTRVKITHAVGKWFKRDSIFSEIETFLA